MYLILFSRSHHRLRNLARLCVLPHQLFQTRLFQHPPQQHLSDLNLLRNLRPQLPRIQP
uniref:Uncharacterized protein n=1 Tax=uncultured marine virus TaxID=186617 RepID=A0A0F7L2R9_9VIRU|nr:hypothetical protein [uncultured marine virus]